MPPRASDGQRRLFSGSDAELIDDIRALRDLGVGAIDFERPDEEAVIAAMREHGSALFRPLPPSS